MNDTTQFWVIGFADIAGSTRLYESVGDHAAKDLILRAQTDIARVVERCHGHVQEIVGDEVLFRFSDVNLAAACACQIQQHSDPALRVRIGLHFGPLIVAGQRLFGDTLNTASRVTGIAQSGQIICSETLVARMDRHTRAMTRRFDEVRVKGKRQPLVVHDLAWRPASQTEILPINNDRPCRGMRLRLTRGETSHRLKPADTPVHIGRDAHCRIRLVLDSISRQHASIAFDRGRFLLIDSSTNGSYVRPEGVEAIYLRREALPLVGRGDIAFGAPFGDDDSHVIHYICGQEDEMKSRSASSKTDDSEVGKEDA